MGRSVYEGVGVGEFTGSYFADASRPNSRTIKF